MRTKDKMLADCETARNNWACMALPKEDTAVNLADDVIALLEEAKWAAEEIDRQEELQAGQAVYIAGQRNALTEKDAEVKRLRKCLVWYMNHTIGEKDYYNDTHVDELLEQMPK